MVSHHSKKQDFNERKYQGGKKPTQKVDTQFEMVTENENMKAYKKRAAKGLEQDSQEFGSGSEEGEDDADYEDNSEDSEEEDDATVEKNRRSLPNKRIKHSELPRQVVVPQDLPATVVVKRRGPEESGSEEEYDAKKVATNTPTLMPVPVIPP